MKSHELAQALSALARLLKAGPDVDISQLKVGEIFDSPTNRDLALNLSTLVSLSRVDKSKWMELIREYGFPIEARPRDASRDVFGKICAYLETNPKAQEQLKAVATKASSKSSPELLKALTALLKDPRADASASEREGKTHEPSSE